MDEKPSRTIPDAEFVFNLMVEHERIAHANAFTAAEMAALREFLDDLQWRAKTWKYVANKFAAIRTWAVWIAAVIGAFTVGATALKSAVQFLGK